MKKNKKSFKRILAFILILAGVGTMTFPFAKRSVNTYVNKKEYKEFVKKTDPKEDEKLVKKAQAYNKKIKKSTQAMVDPFDKKNFENETILKDKDQIFAYLSIPKLDKYLPIYLDASLDHIARGVAQISGTDIPIGGESTRSVIAGHRGWWGDTMFLYIDDLKKGDSIFVERGGEKMEYQVSSKEVIGPYDWDALKPVDGEDMITLLTCSPFLPPRPNRLLVNATRVKKEEPISKSDKPTEVKDNEEDISPTKKAKLVDIGTYALSALGIIVFIIVLTRFIKYLRN